MKKFTDIVNENNIPKLNREEEYIVNDILSLNESIGDWWNSFINYGKKGFLTAAVILTVAFSTQAQKYNKTDDVIKTGIEMSQDNSVKKDVYSFFVGLCSQNISESIQKGNIEAAGFFKELSKYYQQLRDNKTPPSLSDGAKKYISVLKNISNKLDKNDVAYFINYGKDLKTMEY